TNSISTGGTASDGATISGAAPTAGGTVTYTIYSENTCTTPATTGPGNEIDAQPAPPATVTNCVAGGSGTVTFQKPGTYYWQAVYSGDLTTNTGGSHSACTSETITVNSPAVTITKTTDTATVN